MSNGLPELAHGTCHQAIMSYRFFLFTSPPPFVVFVRLTWKKVLGRKGFSSYVDPYCLTVLLRLVSIYQEAYCL